MEALSLSSTTITTITTITKSLPISEKPPLLHSSTLNLKSPNSSTTKTHFKLSSSSPSFISCTSVSTSTYPTSSSRPTGDNRYWMVLMKNPPIGVNSKAEIIDYYVRTVDGVLGSEEDAQMCMYHVSLDTHFGFCCDVDEETVRKIASLPEVQSVRPEPDFYSTNKDYSCSKIPSSYAPNLQTGSLLFPAGNSKHWLVRVNKPGVGVVTKAQMVDYYAQILTKVLGNEKDAQMCLSHVSWQSNFGFCCELDEECARELAGVPGVQSVQPDKNFESENKDYGGHNLESSTTDSSEASQTAPVKTKKLFITGLSFYTSEKTLRAAFEGFGELVEVKIIMDPISKRSKGYAFVEYTTEEAASEALKEMNGKIINGWMIVVDVAKTTPPKYSRRRSR